MTRAQLNVPQHAPEQLHRLGHSRLRTRVTGCVATQWWWLPEQLPAPEPPPRRRDPWACSAMTFEELDIL
jgi:hypothetical protein